MHASVRNFMGWFRSESVQELVGLDISYGGVGAASGLMNIDGGDQGVKEEYLDAYEKYRQTMREKRNTTSMGAMSDDDEDL